MYTKSLKIGVLGSGIVGRVLGAAFAKEGHPVMLGSRNTAKHEILDWVEENPGVITGSFANTAAYADIIVIAT